MDEFRAELGFGGGAALTPQDADAARKRARKAFDKDPAKKGWKIVKPKSKEDRRHYDMGRLIIEGPGGQREAYWE